MAPVAQPGDAGLVPPTGPVALAWGHPGAAGWSPPSRARCSCRPRPHCLRGPIPR